MILDRHGIHHDSILDAIKAIRDFDRRYAEPYPADTIGPKNLRADLDAIIASASGAAAAAGLPADEVRARAMGRAA
jgi:hypothetical protein